MFECSSSSSRVFVMWDNCMMTPGTGTTRPSCQCPASRAESRCRGQETSSSTLSRRMTLGPTSVRWLPYYYNIMSAVSVIVIFRWLMGLGGRRGLQLTWRSHVSILLLLSMMIQFLEVILKCLLSSKVLFLYIFWPMRWLIFLSLVANEIPEYLIIALLIRILHWL